MGRIRRDLRFLIWAPAWMVVLLGKIRVQEQEGNENQGLEK